MRHRILIAAALLSIATIVAQANEAAAQGAGKITVRNNIPHRDASNKHCALDLALPASTTGKPRPAIVVIHGGGWIEGDKSSFATAEHGVPGNIAEFAELGFVAATINYRLAGVAPYPAALEDCRAAVDYLRTRADEFQIDPQRVGAYGNSAGGHLALLLALDTEPLAGGDQVIGMRWSHVAAAVSDSGPLELARQYEQNQLRTVIEKSLGGPPDAGRAALYRRASPASHISGNVPPLLLIYGDKDEQVDVRTADDFVTALAKAGVADVSYIRLAAIGHCPHSLLRVRATKTIVNEFFVRTLRPAE